MDRRNVTRDRATLWWGIAAVVCAVLTSVFAAGWFLDVRSVSTSAVRVSGPVREPATVPASVSVSVTTTIPTTVRTPATPPPTRPAPKPILRSTTLFPWTAWVWLAGLVAVVALPLFTRNTPSAQKVRSRTAAVFGVGAILTVQSIGLLYIPTLAALVMAARTGRHPPTAASPRPRAVADIT